MNFYNLTLIDLEEHSLLHYLNGNNDILNLFSEQFKLIHLVIVHKLEKYNIHDYISKWTECTVTYFSLNIDITDSENALKLIVDALQPCVFIHIPKTGGSTFVNLLLESMINQTHANMTFDRCHFIENVKQVHIQHLDFKKSNRPSKCFPMFTDKNNTFYQNKKVFTLVRHPVDRLISEYIFQSKILSSNNAAILKNLKQNPQTFEEYIKCPEVWNYQTAFLIGKGVADTSRPSKEDLSTVIETVDKFNIKLGTTDEYSKFIKMFKQDTYINLKEEVNQLKKAPDHIKSDIIKKLTQEMRDYIIETNCLDYELYLHAKK